MTFAVVLPLPPSLNNAFVNAPGRGRVKSARYRAWLTEAGFMLKIEPRWKVKGPVRVHIAAPLTLRADLDNIIKPLLDLLVAHGRIDDDRNVAALEVEKIRQSPDTCHVEVAALPGLRAAS